MVEIYNHKNENVINNMSYYNGSDLSVSNISGSEVN